MLSGETRSRRDGQPDPGIRRAIDEVSDLFPEVSGCACAKGFYGHVREYTVGELRAMFDMSGFEVERVALTNEILRPTPVGKDAVGLHYSREFQINSVRQAVLAIYLLVSSTSPGTEYEALVMGRKRMQEAKGFS